MRAVLLAGVSALMIGLSGIAAGAQQGDSGKEVTGIVTQVDKENRQFVVDGQTYSLEQSGGANMMPQAGNKVKFSYADRGGQKIVTRIGQAGQ
jgi:hypothetical protein